MPADTPVTTPLLLTVATAVLLLLHTPPTVALLKVVVDPTHALAVPVIGLTVGYAYTVNTCVTVVLQPLLPVTV